MGCNSSTERDPNTDYYEADVPIPINGPTDQDVERILTTIRAQHPSIAFNRTAENDRLVHIAGLGHDRTDAALRELISVLSARV